MTAVYADLQDPSADIRAEIAERSGLLDPLNKIWFHKTAAAVIDADRCVRCGSCVAACPSQSIAIASDGLPTLVRMCTGCSACWDYCPLAGLRPERLWRIEGDEEPVDTAGRVLATYTARAAAPAAGAQDGGVVTALLEALFTAGQITGAIVTKPQGPFAGEAIIARTVEEIRGSAGSVYDQSLPLALLNDPPARPDERLALVGTPCQVTGLRALQRYDWRYRRSLASYVKYAIALFCTRSFDGKKLFREIASRGLPVAGLQKIGVSEGKLEAHAGDGSLLFAAPVKEFDDAALGGCSECADFSGRLADISVGSVGSAEGATTVLVRSEAGIRAWETASNHIASTPGCDLERVQRSSARNTRRAEAALERPLDPEAPLWISYEEHLSEYSGTERAPVTPPAHRSHHYTVAC
jgi:coenzyme F420 hydrogenase subunit beta